MRVYKRRFVMEKNKTMASETKPKDLYFPVEGVRFQDLYDWQEHKPEETKYSMSIHCTRRFTGTLVKINEKTIALFRYGQTVYAMDEKCPHQGGPLHLGDIESLGTWVKTPCVVCPWHSWTFSLETGEIKKPTKGVKLQLYPVKILEDGKLMIAFESFDPGYFNGDIDF